MVLAASEFATQGVLLGDGQLSLHLQCHISYVELTATYPGTRPSDVDLANGRGSKLWLFDELSAKVIESVSRASGAGPADGAWQLWCQIPTGHLPGPIGPWN